jgi:uncharacterized membrane protein (DUF106 family)
VKQCMYFRISRYAIYDSNKTRFYFKENTMKNLMPHLRVIVDCIVEGIITRLIKKFFDDKHTYKTDKTNGKLIGDIA